MNEQNIKHKYINENGNAYWLTDAEKKRCDSIAIKIIIFGIAFIILIFIMAVIMAGYTK